MGIQAGLVLTITLATILSLAGKTSAVNGLQVSKRDALYLDPCSQLDDLITYISRDIPGQIDAVKSGIESSKGQNIIMTYTDTLIGIFATFKGVYADLVDKDIAMQPVRRSDLLNYGAAFLGVASSLVPTVSKTGFDPSISCGSEDYLSVLRKYSLDMSIDKLVDKVGSDQARSLVNEFGSWATLALKCILDSSSSSKSAFEIGCSIDELVTAFNMRLDLIDQGKCYSSEQQYSYQGYRSV